MSLSDLIGTEPVQVTDISTLKLLDTVYTNGAIWLNDVQSVFFKNTVFETPLPLIGFKIVPEGEIPLLKYEWSTYPYLNRKTLFNAAIKKEVAFSIALHDPITNGNSVLKALVKREGLKAIIEKYADAGGTFTILTMWGILTNCVLDSLSGAESEGGLQGTKFIAGFIKPQFNTSNFEKTQSDFMQAISNGGTI